MDEAAAVPALVEAARRGSGDAMDALYRRFAPVVHGVLLGYVQKADADDLTQDVFESALQRLHQLREAAAFPGWLLGIARNAALAARRRPASSWRLPTRRPRTRIASTPSARSRRSGPCRRRIARRCCCAWWKA